MVARDSISDGKYVVFKVDDFYQFIISLWDDYWGKEERSQATVEEVARKFVVMDATVLRDQDILTAPALNAYADAAMIIHDHWELVEYPDKKTMESLRDRVEFFRGRAVRAHKSANRKMPD